MASEPRLSPDLPEGWVAFVKRDCPTCVLVEPVLAELAKQGSLTVFTQDDPSFPEALPETVRVDDTSLEMSWHNEIEAVPTLLRVESGQVKTRTEGWHRGDWESLTGCQGLQPVPEKLPGRTGTAGVLT